jgi:hypothetical protein
MNWKTCNATEQFCRDDYNLLTAHSKYTPWLRLIHRKCATMDKSQVAKIRVHPGSSTISLVFKCSPLTIATLNTCFHQTTDLRFVARLKQTHRGLTKVHPVSSELIARLLPCLFKSCDKSQIMFGGNNP